MAIKRKRKRSDSSTDADKATVARPENVEVAVAVAVAVPDYRRQRQIAATFEQSAQQVEKAFRLAKSFERQKLGRRQKQYKEQQQHHKKKRQYAPRTSVEKPGVADDNKRERGHGESDGCEHAAELARIEAEIVALKALDTAASAKHLLAKSLLKIKAVASNPNLPEDISSPVPVKALTGTVDQIAVSSSSGPAANSTNASQPTSSKPLPLLNVHARLCNSNPVKQAFARASAEVKREFGVDEVALHGRKPKTIIPCEKIQFSSEISGPLVQQIEAQPDSDTDLDSCGARVVLSDTGSSQDDAVVTRHDAHSHSDKDEIGAPDDSDSDLSMAELERQLAQEGVSRVHAPGRNNPYSGSSRLAAVAKTRQKPAAGALVATVPAAKSSFLPGLTMGGYISGSGSDIEDHLEMKKPKTNRRGQRARQAIWEKKFGKTAKHLQRQVIQDSWDPKRGAVDAGSGRYAKDANRVPLGQSRHVQPKRAQKMTRDFKKVVPKERDGTGPLHPSWEAAKNAKEKNNGPVVFQGKKTSFD